MDFWVDAGRNEVTGGLIVCLGLGIECVRPDFAWGGACLRAMHIYIYHGRPDQFPGQISLLTSWISSSLLPFYLISPNFASLPTSNLLFYISGALPTVLFGSFSITTPKELLLSIQPKRWLPQGQKRPTTSRSPQSRPPTASPPRSAAPPRKRLRRPSRRGSTMPSRAPSAWHPPLWRARLLSSLVLVSWCYFKFLSFFSPPLPLHNLSSFIFPLVGKLGALVVGSFFFVCPPPRPLGQVVERCRGAVNFGGGADPGWGSPVRALRVTLRPRTSKARGFWQGIRHQLLAQHNTFSHTFHTATPFSYIYTNH